MSQGDKNISLKSFVPADKPKKINKTAAIEGPP
jgi:hypothetical protein